MAAAPAAPAHASAPPVVPVAPPRVAGSGEPPLISVAPPGRPVRAESAPVEEIIYDPYAQFNAQGLDDSATAVIRRVASATER
jgi:hypothetical protein